MKNLIISLIMSVLFSYNVYSQATTAPGNTWGGILNEYIGWDNTSNTSLRIKHALNYPINFYTQAGNTTFNNQRMTIFEDPSNASSPNAGFVGIGYPTPPRHLTITTQGTGVVAGTGLFGFPPSMVELLVAGGDGRYDTSQQVAEFRSTIGSSSSIGIRIRGSRGTNQDADCNPANFEIRQC